MSEVAALRQQIELTCEGMQRGLTGYAGVARHRFIAQKHRELQTYQEQLANHIGEELSITILTQLYDKSHNTIKPNQVEEEEKDMNKEPDFKLGTALSVTQIKVPPYFNEDVDSHVRRILQEHHITLDEYPQFFLLRFPDGSIMKEELPRIRYPRYEIQLPDAYIFYASQQETGLYALRFKIDELPEDLQRRYEDL